ncbi:hypothetical protein ACOSP7_009861 [Xanthoceras sorbifolium]
MNGGTVNVKGCQVAISVEAINEYYGLENVVNHTGIDVYARHEIILSPSPHLDQHKYNQLASERHEPQLLEYDSDYTCRVRPRIDDEDVEGSGLEPLVNQPIPNKWRAAMLNYLDM